MNIHVTEEPVILGSGKALRLQRSKDAVQVFALITVAVPVMAYLRNVGLDFGQDLAGWLDTVNRLSALLGTSLLLIHMLLTSRVPWLESIIGLDRLTASHKKLGKPVLYLFLVHFSTSVMAYAVTDGTGLIPTFFGLIGHYPEIALALASLVLMVVVVLSSIRAARKKLSYEAWYLIHLTSYTAVIAAIPHQFVLGSEFLASPWLSAYFAALYFFVLFNLIWFRAALPLLRSLIMGQKVESVTPEANRTTSIVIGGRGLQRLNAQAGQFFMLRILTKQQWWRPHPFSVSASPNGSIRFTVGNRGDDTAELQNLKPGTRVLLEGPYGIFSENQRVNRKVTLLAAGIGIAPVRALAESMAAEPGDITVIYRVTDTSDAALLEEVKQICRLRQHTLELPTGPRASDVEFLPSPNSDEASMTESERLLALAPDIQSSDIYVCGPVSWTASVLSALNDLDIRKSNIHVEEFAW